jgi:hypothetical protein
MLPEENRLKPGESYKPHTYLIPPCGEGEVAKFLKTPVDDDEDEPRPSVITLCKVWGREKDKYYWGCDTDGVPTNASNEADKECRNDGNSFCAIPVCSSFVDSCTDYGKV